MFTFGGDYARLLFQNQLNSKLGLARTPTYDAVVRG